MNKLSLTIWIGSSILYLYISHFSKDLDFFGFLDIVLFLIATYVFMSITKIKDKNKSNFEKLTDACDFIAKYYLAVFALFSVYLFLIAESLFELGLSFKYGLLWYTLLYLLIFLVEFAPTSKLFIFDFNPIIPKMYFLFILFAFDISFSEFTGILNVQKIGLLHVIDNIYFFLICYVQSLMLIFYSSYFFENNYKIFSG